MPEHEAPTVAERQRVERLVAAVLAGLDAGQAVGDRVTDRLGIVTAVMLGEAAEEIYDEPDGVDVDLNTPAYRRYAALSDLFGAMAEREARPA